jgi:low affinity Fe/Cu permease
VEPTVPSRTPLSRVLHRVDDVIAHSWAAGVVGMVVGGFVVALVIADFPESWEVFFSTVVSAVTVVMVFVLHHTQRREQAATQLKLDELIRALPEADDRFVRVQASEDDEVAQLEQELIDHHHATRSSCGRTT